MSERYTKLFSLPGNLYAEGSPVVVSAGNLLKDQQTGKVLAQLKIKNISPKAIKAVTVVINAMDTAGSPLAGEAHKEYLDLNAKQGEEFGQKVPVLLPNSSTRGFTAEVSKAVFSDNSSWKGTAAPWAPLPAPERIADRELTKQFAMKFGGACDVLPQAHRDLWLCACGVWNRDEKCYACEKEKAPLLSLDLDALNAEKDARLAQEEAEREAKAAADKAAEEERARKTKKLMSILVPAAVVCAAAFLLLTKVIIPNSQYKKAKALYNAGQYEEAVAAFESLDGYKDSKDQIHSIKTDIAEQENAAVYEKAEALLKAGDYDGASDEFLRLKMKNYKDSEQRYMEARCAKADELLTLGKYVSAINIYSVFMPDQEIQHKMREAEYLWADSLLASGEYSQAVAKYDELGSYRDSRSKALEAKYQWANSLLSFGTKVNHENIALARELFEQIGTYKDAQAQLQLFQKKLLSRTKKENNQSVNTLYYYHDEFGRDITNGEVYDENGRVIEDKNYVYSYDNNGRLIQKASKSSTDKHIYSYTIRNGLVMEKRDTYTFWETNRHLYIYNYKYDNAGRLIWEELTHDGKKERYTDYIYDDEGHMICEKIYDKGYSSNYPKNPTKYYEYTYGEDGLMMKEQYYNTNGYGRLVPSGAWYYESGYIYAPKASVSWE